MDFIWPVLRFVLPEGQSDCTKPPQVVANHWLARELLGRRMAIDETGLFKCLLLSNRITCRR